jgi:polar amino acid transport system substrate-binding protein
MRKVLLFSGLLLLMLSFNVCAEIKVLTFACEDKEDVPSVMGNSSDIVPGKPGATIECLRIIEQKLGIKINIKRLPWKRALEGELKNGTIDGVFTASYKKEREAFGAFPMKGDKPDTSRSLYSSDYSFYKLKASNLEWDGKALKNLKGNIGAPAGYSVVDDLKKMGYPVEESPGTKTDLQKLAVGRLGAVIALELTADNFLEKDAGLAKVITKVDPPMVNKPYYIMLSHQFVKANPDLAAKFWDAVKEMREKEYKKLASRYLD